VPLETFTGTHVPSLLHQARASLGPDAIIVGVHREGGRFTVVATNDPVRAPLGAASVAPAVPADFRRLLVDQVSEGSARPAPAPAPRAARAARTARPRLIALVGPTGAGKTTTIAKLATSPDAFGHQRVGLLGLDGYRVGAVEQLATYAELAGLPLATASSEAELAPALARLADCEVVLIDTPGRSPTQVEALATLRRWLLHLAPDEVHAVIPAGLMPQLVRRLVAQYAGFGVTHLLATKLDECPTDSRVFDIAAADGRPMRWCTDGQEVPSDLRDAERWLTPALARHAERKWRRQEVA
jgi:flagellar biosynthesis protein FlhF